MRCFNARAAAEREGSNFKVFQDFCLKNGSPQDQILAWTVSVVPNSTAAHPKTHRGVLN